MNLQDFLKAPLKAWSRFRCIRKEARWLRAVHRPELLSRLDNHFIPESFDDIKLCEALKHQSTKPSSLRFWISHIPFAKSRSKAMAELLVFFARRGHFEAVRILVEWGDFSVEILNETMAVLMDYEHLIGSRGDQRWETLSALQLAGAHPQSALNRLNGRLRLFSCDELGCLEEWGLRVPDMSDPWKVWGSLLQDPLPFRDACEPIGSALFSVDTFSVNHGVLDSSSTSLNALMWWLDKGLDVNAVNYRGRTPMHDFLSNVRCSSKKSRIADVISAWHALSKASNNSVMGSASAIDNEGQGLLHALCENGGSPFIPWEIVESIVQNDPCSVFQVNKFGQTPLDVFRATHRVQGNKSQHTLWQLRAEKLEALQVAARLTHSLSKSTVSTAQDSARVRL